MYLLFSKDVLVSKDVLFYKDVLFSKTRGSFLLKIQERIKNNASLGSKINQKQKKFKLIKETKIRADSRR